MPPTIPVVCVALLVLLALAIDNALTPRLRDTLTLGGGVVTFTVLVASALIAGRYSLILQGSTGAVAMWLVLFAVELGWPGLMGFGTVKAALPLGIAAGCLGFAAWVAALLGLASTMIVLVIFAMRRSRRVPTGGALVVALIAAWATAW